MRSQYSPESLIAPTTVHVVNLEGIYPNRVDLYMREAANAPMVTLTGASAAAVARLWRQLPKGEQSRCHIPPFGLRFLLDDKVYCQASICWKCDNIFGEIDGQPFAYDFDSQHAVSQSLLSEVKAAFTLGN